MVDITITVPQNKLNEFRTGFLRSNPIPLDENEQPEFTELAWFKDVLMTFCREEYKRGKRSLAEDAGYTYDNDVVE